MTAYTVCVGRQYDKDGNLRQWWNNATIRAFQERAECFTKQYSQTKLQPFGLNVSLVCRSSRSPAHVHVCSCYILSARLQIDGINTQGENIADNGGLKEAFRVNTRVMYM